MAVKTKPEMKKLIEKLQKEREALEARMVTDAEKVALLSEQLGQLDALLEMAAGNGLD